MAASNDPWLMRSFNTLFDVVAAAFVCVLVLASIYVRDKSERTRQTILVSACLLTIVGFFAYKYSLSLDSDYNVIRAPMGGFTWWAELPLHLCNINMLLVPLAVLRRSRPLMSFCFFVGPLGAMMALAMPAVGFYDYPLYLPRILGFYGTHFMVAIECLAVVTFGFYQPRTRDLPLTFMTVLIVGLCIHAFNMLLRLSGLYARANYFYTIETEGIGALDLFYSWIPMPFLYLLPSLPILAVYMALVSSLLALIDRHAARETEGA